LPACIAVIVTDPWLLIVTWLPVISAIAGLEEEYETGNPDVAFAVRLKGASLTDLVESVLNVMAFPVPGVIGGSTVTVRVSGTAAFIRSFPFCVAVIVVVPTPRRRSIDPSSTAIPGGLLLKVTGKPLLLDALTKTSL
jgi:hypothetical protein